MKHLIYITITFILVLATSCKKEITEEVWLIPSNEIFDGGPGKDGIQALTNPDFINAEDAEYLSDNDLILGYVSGDIIKAYPHMILDRHEIINDDIGTESLAVIYCPLTGTGFAWDRVINNKKTTFGVSGLLYNSNIIPYDRETGSNWSQLKFKCVNGELIETEAQTYNMIETTWGTWKEMFPDTKVVSSNTGYSLNYDQYPYGDYKFNHTILFPIDKLDQRLFIKERVLGVITNNKGKAYRFEHFTNNISLINDQFENEDLLVVGSIEKNYIIAFKKTFNDLTFEAVQDSLPIILTDNEGNTWNILGEAVSGPRTGSKLKSVLQLTGYWFSWGTFFHNLDLYE